MIAVSKGVLKARMLEFFRRVEQTGEPLIVTSHGKPVLKITPLSRGCSVDELFADVRGKLDIGDDILQPETGEWGGA